MPSISRRDLLQAGVGAIAASATTSPLDAATPTGRCSLHLDHVLGTSLDVWIVGGDSVDGEVERIVTEEIDRLSRVFSPFDSGSEASRLSRTSGPFEASNDMIAVLREYERFVGLTDGACSPQTGGLAALWKTAAHSGSAPDQDALAQLTQTASTPGWRIVGSRTVVRTNVQPLDLCSIAKGYILGRAVEVVRQRFSSLPSLMVDLGGDLGGWGEWLVGVQDPARPEHNAEPMTVLRLRNRAVATSGGYQRGFDVAGVRHSHLIDPRTGRPADAVASATVVAGSNLVANALATVLCVLSPEEGLRLASRFDGAECLVVAADGEQFRSEGFAALEVEFDDKDSKKKPAENAEKKPEKTGPKKSWVAGKQVNVAIEIPSSATKRRYRRPYVAVWIEDESNRAVRSITVWGNSPRWLPTMSAWWEIGRNDRTLVKAVTRATRAPGKYAVAWDGKDDKGVQLPQGTYTVKVEVHREHGRHVYQNGKIECGDADAKISLPSNAESGEVVVEYGKAK